MDLPYKYWEFDSICPHCGFVNHVRAPAGEHVVCVVCEHCPYAYEYTHVVHEHMEVEEEN